MKTGVQKIKQIEVPVKLDWPAMGIWPKYLFEVHKAIAESEGSFYRDKDIMVCTNLYFEQDGMYDALKFIDVRILRFNERQSRNPKGLSYQADGEDFRVYLKSCDGRQLEYTSL